MHNKNHLLNEENRNYFTKILITTLFLIGLFFIYQIINIIALLLFAIFLNILFAPFLNRLNKWRINDWVWMFIIYTIIFTIILIVVFSIVPIFIEQISLLINSLSNYVTQTILSYQTSWIDWLWLPKFLNSSLSYIDENELLDINELLNSLKDNVSTISTFVWKNLKNFLTNWAWVIFSITWFFINFFLVFIFTLFIALERGELKKFMYEYLPNDISKNISQKEDKIVKTLYKWLKWQIILCICIFFATLIWLFIIKLFWVNIDKIFSLALIAWLMEFVPYIWPFIAILPAIAIALWLWFNAVIAILILYIIIQQIENNILVPYIMWKTLSLSPFSVLIAMIIWASLFWIIWIIIAIPVVSIVKIFIWK